MCRRDRLCALLAPEGLVRPPALGPGESLGHAEAVKVSRIYDKETSRTRDMEPRTVGPRRSVEGSQLNRIAKVVSRSHARIEVRSYSVLSHANGGFCLESLCIENEPRRASSKRAPTSRVQPVDSVNENNNATVRKWSC